MQRYGVTELVISIPEDVFLGANDLCDRPPTGVHVTCFKPEPSTTRGEGEELRDLVAARGWNSVIVVTSRYHISRARMIIKRCYSGELYMASTQEQISPWQWAYQFVYQSAGYVKAQLDRGC